MLSFPYAEGTLPQKLGRSCNHPHGAASAKEKKKCTEKCMAKALTKQRGWLQGPLLLCPRPCVGLWLHSNAGRGQGVCPHVPGAGSKAVLSSWVFPVSAAPFTLLSSPSFTPCPQESEITHQQDGVKWGLPSALCPGRTQRDSVPWIHSDSDPFSRLWVGLIKALVLVKNAQSVPIHA